MSSEIADFKRRQLQDRQRKRDQENDSILGQFDVELDQEAIENCSDVEVTLEDKPLHCKACGGKGWIKSLFSRWECDRCFGTTYDLSNPIAIIKWQKLCLEWARSEVVESRKALLNATMTSSEREANAVEEFYKNARCKD